MTTSPWHPSMFVHTTARFAQALAIAETSADLPSAFYPAFEIAADIRAMSDDDAWKEPTNAFRDACRALVGATWLRVPDAQKAHQMALRRSELVAAGRAVLALPPPPPNPIASATGGGR